MDNKNFIFIPTWVKIISFSVISSILTCSIVFVFYFLSIKGKETWVLVGMSTAQMAGSGLILMLVVAFSQRDATFTGVQKQADFFLENFLPRTFLYIETDQPEPIWYEERTLFNPFKLRNRNLSKVKIEVLHNPGEVGASYIIHTSNRKLRLFVELNVWKITVAYYIPAESKEISDIRKKDLSFSFPADGVDGFRTFSNYSYESFDDKYYLNMIIQNTLPDDFLQSNLRKLFVANLIMTHTQSLIRNTGRDGIPLSYDE